MWLGPGKYPDPGCVSDPSTDSPRGSTVGLNGTPCPQGSQKPRTGRGFGRRRTYGPGLTLHMARLTGLVFFYVPGLRARSYLSYRQTYGSGLLVFARLTGRVSPPIRQTYGPGLWIGRRAYGHGLLSDAGLTGLVSLSLTMPNKRIPLEGDSLREQVAGQTEQVAVPDAAARSHHHSKRLWAVNYSSLLSPCPTPARWVTTSSTVGLWPSVAHHAPECDGSSGSTHLPVTDHGGHTRTVDLTSPLGSLADPGRGAAHSSVP
jgi:hypothetical protein